MRILVIDDYVEAELAIAHVLQGTPHVVAGVRDPRQLPRVLDEAEPFDLALVDMIFVDCPMTGLGALRILAERSKDTRSVVRCSDDEDNRQLHLLAAFTFFAPLALAPRRDGPDVIEPLLEAVGRGGSVTSAGDRYRHQGPPPAPVDELLGNKTDLAIWQELTRFDKRTDIARAAFVSASTVDKFITDMYPVVEQLQARFGHSGAAAAGGREHAHNAPLIRLAHFARLHKDFFRDPDLEPLLAERWEHRPPRQLSEASAGVRKARPLGRRRAPGPG
jgi:DNA-binding NarL/FixJ family response regulator